MLGAGFWPWAASMSSKLAEEFTASDSDSEGPCESATAPW